MFKNSLKLQGVQVSHVSILKWIKKYTTLMTEYVEKIHPNVSDTWRADEMYIKVAGNMKYLYAMMDDETRFWIAQEVAETKDKHDAQRYSIRHVELMGKKPKTFITDGLPTYKTMHKTDFSRSQEHIRQITLKGEPHNNKMERMNGEIRDREKTMRGLKITETAVLKVTKYTIITLDPHEALDGKTPTEACGITIEGKTSGKL